VEASIARAKSASDASLLRRKGHLKEQDSLIEYVRQMFETHSCEEALGKMERWIAVRSLRWLGGWGGAGVDVRVEVSGALCAQVMLSE